MSDQRVAVRKEGRRGEVRGERVEVRKGGEGGEEVAKEV